MPSPFKKNTWKERVGAEKEKKRKQTLERTLHLEAGAKSLGWAVWYIEYLHTNNKPRQQTSPLATRCDTVETGSPRHSPRGQELPRQPPVTPACTQVSNNTLMTVSHKSFMCQQGPVSYSFLCERACLLSLCVWPGIFRRL